MKVLTSLALARIDTTTLLSRIFLTRIAIALKFLLLAMRHEVQVQLHHHDILGLELMFS